LQITTENAAAVPEMAPTEKLVVGLDRLLRICSVYSVDHPAVVRMAGPVVASLQALAPPGGSVKLRVSDEEGLEVADTLVGPTQPAAARLFELLESAGVEGFEIFREATVEHLYEVGRFLRTRPSGRVAEEGEEAAALPRTIRLVESRFGIGRNSGSRGEARRLLEEILHQLGVWARGPGSDTGAGPDAGTGSGAGAGPGGGPGRGPGAGTGAGGSGGAGGGADAATGAGTGDGTGTGAGDGPGIGAGGGLGSGAGGGGGVGAGASVGRGGGTGSGGSAGSGGGAGSGDGSGFGDGAAGAESGVAVEAEASGSVAVAIEGSGAGSGAGSGEGSGGPAGSPRGTALAVVRRALRMVVAQIENEASGNLDPALRDSIVRLLTKVVRSVLEAPGELSRSSITVGRLLLQMREVLRKASGEETASAVVERALLAAEKHLLPNTVGRAPSPSFDETRPPAADADAEATMRIVRQIEEALATAGDFDPEQLACDDEFLAILLMLRCEAATGGPDPVVERELARALADLPDPRRCTSLVAFIASAGLGPDPAAADRTLSTIARALRRQDPVRFAVPLAEALDSLEPRRQVWLWPHVASELLLGLPPAAGETEEKLLAALLALPVGSLVEEASRLLRTSCARGGALENVVRRVLSPPLVELYDLYDSALTLPESSGIGELVLEAFRMHPPPLPAAKALSALPNLDGRARTLLRLLLAQRRGDEERRRELDQLAVRTLVDALVRHPPNQRDQLWVAEAVRALTALPSPESEALLRRVATEKRFFFLHSWPSRCRRIARSGS
jgi:hypothetical protein